MKKNTKIVLATLSLLAAGVTVAPFASPVAAETTAPAAPATQVVSGASKNASTAAGTTTTPAATATTSTTTPATTATPTTAPVATTTTTPAGPSVSMLITKTGTSTPSEAAMFLGKSAQVTVKDGKVTELTIHVSGATQMTKGQDMSKMMSSVTLNGVEGKQANVAKDGSSLDYVFTGDAYKEGKGVIKFTLNVMGKVMNESADVTLGAVEGVKTPAEQPATTTTTKKSAKKVKRTLKHNAFVYKKSGKRLGKKVLKKGTKVSTSKKAVKLHGKAYYQVAKNQYVKKANF
ncbi:SLAP domain-containing protein [Lactobacillus gigeriorum]|nr:SLAP domain-containing protein [Lactobacillus gigeriorum]CCI86904.1 Putative bacterial surface layer protein [Lactobacillus gigeriorum DSM 23908 = CRBIP 24.85]